jgi:hypothetical protein
MAEKIIVFRISNWFLEQINEFCRKEEISYKELFERAIDLLCKKYLEDSNEKGKDSGGADRDSGEWEALQETLQNSPTARADEI